MSTPIIKLPDSVQIDESTYSSTYGKFIVQPLERGYGITIGNSLRRVLLASIPGAAISGIKIDGVLHEFDTIPGVYEDVTQIVLNLKKVRLKLLNKKTNKISLEVSGETTFTAKNIQDASPDVEILNPDLHIATLDSNAKIKIDLYLAQGKGYVPSYEQKLPETGIGIIAIDSIFTPILNVKYEIENVRVGDRNDFEKLILEVTTDGSITPEDAVAVAAKIIKDHIQMFINFDYEPQQEAPVTEKDVEKERIKKILLTTIDDLELSVRSYNCLKAANIKYLADLVRKQESELLKFKNFGKKSLHELTDIVNNFGLKFGMDVDLYINDNNDNK
jgi:DNA-directed RNA polymerase subunit alpha